MRFRHAKLICLLLQVFPCVSAHGRSWHVSQQKLPGIDADAQVRSIGEAVSRLRPGDTVVVYGGVYREQVKVDKSCTPAKPITIRAATGEFVVVTGADRLTAWQKDRDDPGVFWSDWPHEFVSWNERNTQRERFISA